ncbi:MAG: hypothetical protein E6Q44_04905 [Flavobacteriales bacterium]|nr:MAG: hypothetical protein E6Q44_04905 [Flavobacteriales bacterium]
MRRSIGIAMVLALAVLLGAVREFFFVNLNYAIDHLQHHRAYSFAHSAFTAAVSDFSLKQLVLLKWAAALVFIIAMLALTIAMARVLWGDHRYLRVLVVGTTLVAALALLLQLAGGLHPAFALVSVKLLHLLQYPGMLLFLWVASMLGKSPR